MIALFRLLLVLLVLQTIAYVGLSLYSRSVRKGKLEAHWEKKDAMKGDKQAFVERGLQRYDQSFRRKLILGVYIVPWVAIVALIYIRNYM
ncbi:MAG: hypothetical protein GJ676_10415 [Rhodobacteraceae bacterium]|nr:hypothetical protein [Paracoccaceae bacterium]